MKSNLKKPGGLVMPIIVDYIYEDGTKERINILFRYGEKMIL